MRAMALAILLACAAVGLGQGNGVLSGTVTDSITEASLTGVQVFVNGVPSDTTDAEGHFSVLLPGVFPFELGLVMHGYATRSIIVSKPTKGRRSYLMNKLWIDLPEFDVTEREENVQVKPMPPVMGTMLFRGMKSEVLDPDQVPGTQGAGQARRVFSKVAGVNIWESDDAGIQLGIGARGLSPNRTSHFNVRQQMHDISADALGYPESYYTPTLLGVQRIELIRGAAALQFGTQFGGLLNFSMKGPPDKNGSEVLLDQTVGSFGLNDSITPWLASSNSFVSVGLRKGRTGAYAFYQHRQGEGWRRRSAYNADMAYARLLHQARAWTLEADFTFMKYLAEQPGGLIDADFDLNARQTMRYRNWFRVNWNMASLTISRRFGKHWEVETKTFLVIAERDALGFLGQTQRTDPLDHRTLISGKFNNVGNETRMLRRWELKKGILVASFGFRLYHGTSRTREGYGTAGSDARFEFLDELQRPSSDYSFPNKNAAVFAQSIVPITRSLSITPGTRYEHIDTRADGQFRSIIQDAAGNVLEDTTLLDARARERDLLLVGAGISWKGREVELYANAVQNYRAINYADIQVRSTSLVIDPEIQDERGYNLDLGLRGKLLGELRFDVSTFLLAYKDRIGEYFTRDELNRAVRYRTNVSDARTVGVEMLLQDELLGRFGYEGDLRWSLLVNGSLINARYIDSDISAFEDNRVELVPEWTLRIGSSIGTDRWSVGVQWNSVADQFSDATNVGSDPRFTSTPNAVDGLIPAYQVLDASVTSRFGHLGISFNVNNVTDQRYFTRRASGYPGPGIIPSPGRNFLLSVRWAFGI